MRRLGVILWRLLLPWGGLFAGLLLSLWAVTQSRQAAQFILLTLLHILSQNFSLPVGRGQGNLLPLIGVLGILVLGWPAAAAMTLAGFVLAELSLPLWRPLWLRSGYGGTPWGVRLAQGGIHLLALWAAATFFQRTGGPIPFTAEALPDAAAPLFWLILAYSAAALSLTLLLHTVLSRSFLSFWREDGVIWLAYLVLSQPFALIGGLIFVDLGLLPFTVFCIGVGILAQMNWLSWQRRHILQQQLNQFATINQVGDSLRESLDQETVLARTYQVISKLLPVDGFAVALLDESGRWQELYRFPPTHSSTPYQPDGFTAWVAERGRILDLDQEGMAFARQHNITPPAPLPAYWLGFPLKTAERLIGVMRLQRFDPTQPFSRWNREVLGAVAGQLAASLENARLHGETVRLYNLTDEALARRLEQLHALLDSTQEGVLMLDRRGRVALSNPLAAQLLGRTPEKLANAPIEAEQDAAALGYTPAQWQQLLTDWAHSQAAITRFTRPPGVWGKEKPIHLERQEGPVRAADGQVMGWLMVFRDVTEEQERTAWRTELTRMIVHDLRNPVTTLLTINEMLGQQLQEIQAPPETMALVGTAYLSCTNMLDMIDSLMDVNRMEAGHLVVDADALALLPLLERVLTHVRPLTLPRQITFHLTYPPEIPFVWVDEDIIRRVWLNLLDNALKFTPAGGKITIHLQPEPPLHERVEPGVRAVVQDDGPGIPAEYQERIFDRFVQINQGGAQVRGTGLGLTFCKLAVEAHGGRIWVETPSEGGSRFVFTLPGVPGVLGF